MRQFGVGGKIGTNIRKKLSPKGNCMVAQSKDKVKEKGMVIYVMP